MMDFLKIFVILYMILPVPLMFGILWHTYIAKEPLGIRTFVHGWLCMMALFFCEAVPLVLWKKPLSYLKNAWLVTIIIVTLIVVGKLLWGKLRWKPGKGTVKKNWKYIVLSAGMIVGSILFLQPATDDSTVEIAVEAYVTDTMYQYQPYTDEVYEQMPEDKIYSPAEMYYTVLADMVNAHPAVVVKLLIPVSFLTVFILVYVMWAKVLFKKNPKFRKIFLFFAGCIYVMPIISTNMSMLGIWKNCWKGEVLLGTTILPLVSLYVYEMMSELSEQFDRKKCIKYGVNLAIAAMAAQLFYVKGFLFSCMIIIAGGIIIGIRKFLDRYKKLG